MPETRLFLERRSYRRRRMMDAVRFLPLLCTVFFLVVPLMWPNGEVAGAAMSLSTAVWYLFTVWALAITASFGLWRRIRRNETSEEPDGAPDA